MDIGGSQPKLTKNRGCSLNVPFSAIENKKQINSETKKNVGETEAEENGYEHDKFASRFSVESYIFDGDKRCRYDGHCCAAVLSWAGLGLGSDFCASNVHSQSSSGNVPMSLLIYAALYFHFSFRFLFRCSDSQRLSHSPQPFAMAYSAISLALSIAC